MTLQYPPNLAHKDTDAIPLSFLAIPLSFLSSAHHEAQKFRTSQPKKRRNRQDGTQAKGKGKAKADRQTDSFDLGHEPTHPPTVNPRPMPKELGAHIFPFDVDNCLWDSAAKLQIQTDYRAKLPGANL